MVLSKTYSLTRKPSISNMRARSRYLKTSLRAGRLFGFGVAHRLPQTQKACHAGYLKTLAAFKFTWLFVPFLNFDSAVVRAMASRFSLRTHVKRISQRSVKSRGWKPKYPEISESTEYQNKYQNK
jgi:hypothetical protein